MDRVDCKFWVSFPLISVVIFVLAGCARMSGIETHAQIKDANAFDAGKTIAKAQITVWPTDEWWKVYGDLQLDDLIARTIADNLTLLVARNRIALSQGVADSMYAETLPDISADTSIMRERFTALQYIPPPWAGNTVWNNKAQLSLAYDLDLWGRQESIWRASVNETRAAAAESQQVKLELVNAVVRSYVQMAMEFGLRDIAAEHMEQIEQRIAIARRSLKAGLGTEFQVSEVEVPLPLARAKIEAIDMRIVLLRNQISALSGQGPGAGEGMTRPTMQLNAPVGLPDQLPANLIGRRPDMQACRWRIEAAQQNIAGAKAAFYPNINLLAFAGFQSFGFAQMISNAGAISGVGPAISLPIFDGGRRRGNLSVKTAAYDIAVENYNGLLLRALQDVSDQLATLQSNAKQRAEAETAMQLAHKTYTLAQASYRAGLDNYQHVLDARISELRQQETLVQMQAARLDAYAGLMRALGGGAMDVIGNQAAPR
jgi:NodT family efflux transporter outer membrane factor (OMF) lipoprotein